MHISEILELLERKDFARLKLVFKDEIPVDISEVLEEIDSEKCFIVFRILDKDTAANVFSYLSIEKQKEIISKVSQSKAMQIIKDLDFDDKIDFLSEMPSNFVKTVLSNSKEEERILINQFLNYPENSAGSLMTIEFVSFTKEIQVSEALVNIRKTGLDKETIYSCYITDVENKLEGYCSLHKILMEEDSKVLNDIMEEDIIFCSTLDDQEDIAKIFKKYDLLALPVVDSEGRMVGIITFDDIMDVVDQEATEDFEKMSLLKPSEKKYLDTTAFELMKKRIGWLLILMLTATLTGGIIQAYEELLSHVVVLAAFIPLLMDSAGNAGSQSSALIIRGIALGDIGLKDFFKVFFKECQIGIMAGVILAIFEYLRLVYVVNVDSSVALTVAITLVTTVISAKMMGAVLPMAAKKVGIDPAVMAGPLITSFVDTTALIIYFNVASVLVL